MAASVSSDRENAGLSGPVASVADEYSTAVFDRSGKTLEWRGKTFDGDVHRTYLYDESDRLIRVTNSGDEFEDEFR